MTFLRNPWLTSQERLEKPVRPPKVSASGAKRVGMTLNSQCDVLECLRTETT